MDVGHPSLAAGAYLEQTGLPRTRAPSPAQPRHQERRSVAERSLAQPKEAWREVTVAEGAGAADIPVQRFWAVYRSLLVAGSK